jgi:putative endonuclease
MISTSLNTWLEWLRPTPRPLGPRGERYAARWLRKRGYKIVAGGHRTRYGEIDLVAVLGETIVFVEVKTRASRELGDAAEAVDAQKQRRFARAALGFLKEHGLLEYPVRFDVIAIVWPANARTPELLHLPNAFEPSGFGQFFS